MRTCDDVSLHVALAGRAGARFELHDRGRSRGLRHAIDGGARGEALEVADGGERCEHAEIKGYINLKHEPHFLLSDLPQIACTCFSGFIAILQMNNR